MRAEVERAIRAEPFSDGMGLDMWEEQVLVDLLRKDPPAQVWCGMETCGLGSGGRLQSILGLKEPRARWWAWTYWKES
jgi:hypothetical protein